MVVNLAAYLVGLGYANVQRFALQDGEPDLAVAVIPYGGRGEVDFGRAGLARGHYRLQIKVRGVPEDPEEPGLRIDAIWRALHLQLATLNGTLYRTVTPLQAPIFLKLDARRRAIYVFNVEGCEA